MKIGDVKISAQQLHLLVCVKSNPHVPLVMASAGLRSLEKLGLVTNIRDGAAPLSQHADITEKGLSVLESVK